jgi:EmrB/QacA subfamily drug resistance transporter
MAAMELTVVSTAMPTVIAELGGAARYAWVFTAYMLASTVTVPMYGKLADLYGRKPVLLAALSLFLLGSMASGQARSMNSLIVYRSIQGIGAGGVQPMAVTIVGDIFEVEERAKMQGLFGAVWAIAGLIGPLLGGFIVATVSWRWVFYLNVPFGIASAVVLSRSFVENVTRKSHRLDVAGAATLALAVIALLLGADGTLPRGVLVASPVLFALFVVVERRATEPILPLALFAEPALATSCAVSALAGAAMLGYVTFLPLFVQGVLAGTPTAAGSSIAPMAVAWPISSALCGRLIGRLGFRTPVRIGMVLVSLSGLALVAFLTASDTSLGSLRLAAMGFGLGMGFTNTALVIAIQASVAHEQRGVATASTMFFRNIGSTVGVGVMGGVLAHALLSTANAAGGVALIGRMMGPERRLLSADVLRSISGDLAHGLRGVAWTIAGVSACGMVVAWFFPNVARPNPKRP